MGATNQFQPPGPSLQLHLVPAAKSLPRSASTLRLDRSPSSASLSSLPTPTTALLQSHGDGGDVHSHRRNRDGYGLQRSWMLSR